MILVMEKGMAFEGYVPEPVEVRIARRTKIVAEMGRLFLPGHDREQTPEYEAWRMEYLQHMTDEQWPDFPPGTHSHWTTG